MPAMRLSRLTLAALLFTAPFAHAGALLEVYQHAVQQDKTLQAASFERDAARQARPAAMAAFLPQIGGQADYSLQNQSQQYSTTRFGSPTAQTINQKTEQQGYDFKLSLSQSVFNWEAIQSLKKSDKTLAQAETGFRASQQQLVLRVATAYFNVLAAQDFVRFAEVENKAVARLLEQNKKRFEVGLSAITDVQEAQARFDLISAQKVAADYQLSAANRALAAITGRAETGISALPFELPLTGPEPLDVDVWLAAARSDNLNVLLARLNADLANSDVQIANARHYPTVDLQGGYSNSSGDFTSNNNKSPQSSDGTSIALVAKLPIFAGGAIRAGENSARAIRAARTAQLENAQRVAEQQAGDAYQGVTSGMAQVRALQQAVKSANTALEASQVGVTVGARTSIDVLNAQREVSSADRNLAQARYNYLLSLLQLKFVVGRLGEPELAAIDKLLPAK